MQRPPPGPPAARPAPRPPVHVRPPSLHISAPHRELAEESHVAGRPDTTAGHKDRRRHNWPRAMKCLQCRTTVPSTTQRQNSACGPLCHGRDQLSYSTSFLFIPCDSTISAASNLRAARSCRTGDNHVLDVPLTHGCHSYSNAGAERWPLA